MLQIKKYLLEKIAQDNMQPEAPVTPPTQPPAYAMPTTPAMQKPQQKQKLSFHQDTSLRVARDRIDEMRRHKEGIFERDPGQFLSQEEFDTHVKNLVNDPLYAKVTQENLTDADLQKYMLEIANNDLANDYKKFQAFDPNHPTLRKLQRINNLDDYKYEWETEQTYREARGLNVPLAKQTQSMKDTVKRFRKRDWKKYMKRHGLWGSKLKQGQAQGIGPVDPDTGNAIEYTYTPDPVTGKNKVTQRPTQVYVAPYEKSDALELPEAERRKLRNDHWQAFNTKVPAKQITANRRAREERERDEAFKRNNPEAWRAMKELEVAEKDSDHIQGLLEKRRQHQKNFSAFHRKYPNLSQIDALRAYNRQNPNNPYDKEWWDNLEKQDVYVQPLSWQLKHKDILDYELLDGPKLPLLPYLKNRGHEFARNWVANPYNDRYDQRSWWEKALRKPRDYGAEYRAEARDTRERLRRQGIPVSTTSDGRGIYQSDIDRFKVKEKLQQYNLLPNFTGKPINWFRR